MRRDEPCCFRRRGGCFCFGPFGNDGDDDQLSERAEKVLASGDGDGAPSRMIYDFGLVDGWVEVNMVDDLAELGREIDYSLL